MRATRSPIRTSIRLPTWGQGTEKKRRWTWSGSRDAPWPWPRWASSKGSAGKAASPAVPPPGRSRRPCRAAAHGVVAPPYPGSSRSPFTHRRHGANSRPAPEAVPGIGHVALHSRLVLGLPHPAGVEEDPVVLGQLGIGAVDQRVIDVGREHPGLQGCRPGSPRRRPEEGEGGDVGRHPCRLIADQHRPTKTLRLKGRVITKPHTRRRWSNGSSQDPDSPSRPRPPHPAGSPPCAPSPGRHCQCPGCASARSGGRSEAHRQPPLVAQSLPHRRHRARRQAVDDCRMEPHHLLSLSRPSASPARRTARALAAPTPDA